MVESHKLDDKQHFKFTNELQLETRKKHEKGISPPHMHTNTRIITNLIFKDITKKKRVK